MKILIASERFNGPQAASNTFFSTQYIIQSFSPRSILVLSSTLFSALVSFKFIFNCHPGLSKVSISTPHECSQSPLHRWRYHFSSNEMGVSTGSLCAGAPSLADFAPKVRSKYFDRATHFIESRPHACPDAIRECIFAYRRPLSARQTRCGLGVRCFVNKVRGQDGDPPVVVARVQHQPDDVENPSRRLASAQIVQHQNFHIANRLQNAHLRRFACGIVASLNFLQQFAIVAEQASVSATNQFL